MAAACMSICSPHSLGLFSNFSKYSIPILLPRGLHLISCFGERYRYPAHMNKPLEMSQSLFHHRQLTVYKMSMFLSSFHKVIPYKASHLEWMDVTLVCCPCLSSVQEYIHHTTYGTVHRKHYATRKPLRLLSFKGYQTMNRETIIVSE